MYDIPSFFLSVEVVVCESTDSPSLSWKKGRKTIDWLIDWLIDWCNREEMFQSRSKFFYCEYCVRTDIVTYITLYCVVCVLTAR